ncbi:nitroreductase family protein [bacterium]|nr:nitroreductase family protein [bacterium]
MNIEDAVRKRQSVRKYSEKDVEEDKLNLVLEAARLSPSAKNRQARKFVLVRDVQMRRKLAVAAKNQMFVADAPVVIACCGTDPGYVMTCGQSADAIDVAIAVDHMTLTAVSLGLGTCWIGAFYQDEVKKLLNIPENVQVVELLTLGYPAESEFKTHRKSLNDIVYFESWRTD